MAFHLKTEWSFYKKALSGKGLDARLCNLRHVCARIFRFAWYLIARFKIGHTPRKFPACNGGHLPHQRISAQSRLIIITYKRPKCKFFFVFFCFLRNSTVPAQRMKNVCLLYANITKSFNQTFPAKKIPFPLPQKTSTDKICPIHAIKFPKAKQNYAKPNRTNSNWTEPR